MKCPQCDQQLFDHADQCPHCGFLHAHDHQWLIDLPRQCSLFSDHAGLLKLKERQAVTRLLMQFAQRFPGRFLALMTVCLPVEANFSVSALAIMNRCRFEETRWLDADAGLLLLIDMEQKQATLVYGYHWEGLLDDADVEKCLARGCEHWRAGRYLFGIKATIEALEKIIIRRHRQQNEPQKTSFLPNWLRMKIGHLSDQDQEQRGGSS